ncbi:MAG: N-acetyltransferase [Pyrinomonadaceae bacterium]
MIRIEVQRDEQAISAVLEAAFPTHAESELVSELRQNWNLSISLVAEIDEAIVGHVAFSPAFIDGAAPGMGLAPMAVLPEFQRRGVGTLLANEGLKFAENAAIPFVIVLGDPEYYRRFGFRPAADWNIEGEFGGGPAFQLIEFVSGSVPTDGGLARYSKEFRKFG